ncbi:hypothetical protein [Trinickia mobilis]|uniref:hypothetical protein n=1 Tax=Trinickia mobilis TaxID=2816356 RepID=UPI001A9008D0|nr:hypothetical protein [Trinickia mobilis]
MIADTEATPHHTGVVLLFLAHNGVLDPTIAMYDVECDGDLTTLTHFRHVENSALPCDRPLFSTLEEPLKVLEMCVEKWSTPCPSDCMTVFIGRSGRAGAEVEPLARFDVTARNGLACASVMREDGPAVNTGPVRYLPDDDKAAIVLKILDVLVRGR